jgi:hypothetical protein
MSGNQAHILIENTTPNFESRFNWDLPLGVFPYMLDRPFGLVNKLVSFSNWNGLVGKTPCCLRFLQQDNNLS